MAPKSCHLIRQLAAPCNVVQDEVCRVPCLASLIILIVAGPDIRYLPTSVRPSVCLSVVRPVVIPRKLSKIDHSCYGKLYGIEIGTDDSVVAFKSSIRRPPPAPGDILANSASYPQRDGKWVVATATGWRPSVADWGDGVSASCTVGTIVR